MNLLRAQLVPFVNLYRNASFKHNFKDNFLHYKLFIYTLNLAAAFNLNTLLRLRIISKITPIFNQAMRAILASDLFGRDNKYVFKARNGYSMGELLVFILKTFFI